MTEVEQKVLSTIIINAIVEESKCKDMNEFSKQTGFILTTGFNWLSPGNLIINVSFKDPFFASCTKVSQIIFKEISAVNINKKEIFKIYNTKIKYKQRQINKINSIKQIAYTNIISFISKSFSVDPKIIKKEHITFTKHSRFEIANLSIYYETILVDNSFSIHNYTHSTYAQVLVEANKIYNFYYGKGVDSITNYKINNNEGI